MRALTMVLQTWSALSCMFSRFTKSIIPHSNFSLVHITFADIDPTQDNLPKAPPIVPGENRSESAVSTTHGGVPNNALALDSAAIISIIQDTNLFDPIRTLLKVSIIHFGGKSTACNSPGTLASNSSRLPLPKGGYIVFSSGVANLISLAALAKELCVLYALSVDGTIYIFHNKGKYIKFTWQ